MGTSTRLVLPDSPPQRPHHPIRLSGTLSLYYLQIKPQPFYLFLYLNLSSFFGILWRETGSYRIGVWWILIKPTVCWQPPPRKFSIPTLMYVSSFFSLLSCFFFFLSVWKCYLGFFLLSYSRSWMLCLYLKLVFYDWLLRWLYGFFISIEFVFLKLMNGWVRFKGLFMFVTQNL